METPVWSDAFPAHAGMNRSSSQRPAMHLSVPRACGDEPVVEDQTIFMVTRSPRMRG